MKQKEVVIRRSPAGSVLLLIGCAAFTGLGIFALQTDEWKLVGIIAIAFFGFGGVLYTLFMSWKPVAVISSSGITVPYGWGNNYVAWENVSRFEVVKQTIRVRHTTQTNRYIGVYVKDPAGIVGAGNLSKALSQQVTGWETVPDLLINTAFTFKRIESVMEILQMSYEEYRRSQNILRSEYGEKN